jgi:hypothetical protein
VEREVEMSMERQRGREMRQTEVERLVAMGRRGGFLGRLSQYL